MPVSINGNTGVVTGLAVGGLPDGIVDADMLASNAVTATKLASGVCGKVLQVVEARLTSDFSHTSTSNTDVGLSLSITPSSASNKVLVSFVGVSYAGAGTNHNPYGRFAILRDSTIITACQQGFYMVLNANKTLNGNTKLQILDTPNTTSAITYKIQARSANTSVTQNLSVLADTTGFNAPGTILIAMEVGA